MAITSCKELWTNKNFLLKFSAFVCLFTLISFGHFYVYYDLVFSYEHSCLTIIIALMTTYWLFESTKFTELCLLGVALIKILAALFIDATRARADYSCEQPESVKEVALPQPTVDTRIMREPFEESIATTVKNFLVGITGRPVTIGTISSKISTIKNSTIMGVEDSNTTTVKVTGFGGLSGSADKTAPSYLSYRFAAPPTDDSWDNTSENIQFYVHIVICVIAIILIAVDIFFRARK